MFLEGISERFNLTCIKRSLISFQTEQQPLQNIQGTHHLLSVSWDIKLSKTPKGVWYKLSQFIAFVYISQLSSE